MARGPEGTVPVIKLLLIAALVSIACRSVLGKWPWEYMSAKPTRGQAVFNARKLLSIGDGASRSEIVEAHRRLIAKVHPDRGGTNSQVHEANAARDLLLDDLARKLRRPN
jgi:DnaJ family protein C protein 19